MTRHGLTLAATLAAGMLVGCNTALPGTSRSLGPVDYTAAFAAANEAMAQYYPVESANPVTGVIQARPKEVKAPNERLLGGSPARELATLKLQKEGKNVIAYAAVALQRHGSAVFRVMPSPGENYEGVPDQTPAQREAATTAEQNTPWRTQSYKHDIERKLLDDIARAVQPGATK